MTTATKRKRAPHAPKTDAELHRMHIHPRWLRPLAEQGTCSWHGGYRDTGEPCRKKVNGRRCRAHTNRRALAPVAG